MTSIFTEKEIVPSQEDLKKALGKTFSIWQALAGHAKKEYPGATEEWNYPGAKYGWSFRIKDKKRVIVYLLPRDKFFKVALVFGQKATDAVLKAGVADHIKSALRDAKVYAEGRGIRIDINDTSLTEDIKKLIAIKVAS